MGFPCSQSFLITAAAPVFPGPLSAAHISTGHLCAALVGTRICNKEWKQGRWSKSSPCICLLVFCFCHLSPHSYADGGSPRGKWYLIFLIFFSAHQTSPGPSPLTRTPILLFNPSVSTFSVGLWAPEEENHIEFGLCCAFSAQRRASCVEDLKIFLLGEWMRHGKWVRGVSR